MLNNTENEVCFKINFFISSPSHGLVREEPSQTEESNLWWQWFYTSSSPSSPGSLCARVMEINPSFHGVLALCSATVFVGFIWMSLINFSNFPVRGQASDRLRREHGKRKKFGNSKRSKDGFRATWSSGKCPSLHPNIIPAIRGGFFQGGKNFRKYPRDPKSPWLSPWEERMLGMA